MSRIALSLLIFVATTAQAQVALTATPLTRDQIAAFYTARGFPTGAIASYAQACVISFSFRNEGTTTLHFRLADWRAAEDLHLRPASEWEALWEQTNIPQTARIAFRWAQFPAEQEFEPGDWIMGMATLERRIAGRFRITARYSDEKGKHELVTEAIACAD